MTRPGTWTRPGQVELLLRKQQAPVSSRLPTNFFMVHTATGEWSAIVGEGSFELDGGPPGERRQGSGAWCAAVWARTSLYIFQFAVTAACDTVHRRAGTVAVSSLTRPCCTSRRGRHPSTAALSFVGSSPTVVLACVCRCLGSTLADSLPILPPTTRRCAVELRRHGRIRS